MRAKHQAQVQASLQFSGELRTAETFLEVNGPACFAELVGERAPRSGALNEGAKYRFVDLYVLLDNHEIIFAGPQFTYLFPVTGSVTGNVHQSEPG